MPSGSANNKTDRVLKIKRLGLQPYEPVWQAMQTMVDQRNEKSVDELWLVEHEPVYTQGQAGKPEHVLNPGDIPIVKTDRGGQVTYHGPGQAVIYPLLDLRRMKLGVRDLVTAIEDSVIALLKDDFAIESRAKPDAPGVYVNGDKIASLGLRIRKGRSFHGVSINVDMDLEPFGRINPCGYAGLKMTQISALLDESKPELANVQMRFAQTLATKLGYTALIDEQLSQQ